jgi:hypothetical protein
MDRREAKAGFGLSRGQAKRLAHLPMRKRPKFLRVPERKTSLSPGPASEKRSSNRSRRSARHSVSVCNEGQFAHCRCLAGHGVKDTIVRKPMARVSPRRWPTASRPRSKDQDRSLAPNDSRKSRTRRKRYFPVLATLSALRASHFGFSG